MIDREVEVYYGVEADSDMNKFQKVVSNRLADIQKTLIIKGAEYIRNNDPFHNFNKSARRRNITPEEALYGMLEKHLVSLDDIIEDIKKGIITPLPIAQEKIKDTITYLILLEGLLTKRINDSAN